MEYANRLKKFLDEAVNKQASDLLISVGHPAVLRITGQLINLDNEESMSAEDTKGLAFELMTEVQKKIFLEEKEIDFSYDFARKARFRVNIFFQQGSISLALRTIPTKIKTIEDLKLPAVLHELTGRSQGLVLVTGASGQGKSTTLAAMIDEINHTRSVHIITIEDPIEYIYQSDRAIVDQREVPIDTKSFPNALKAMFRQNPDVIMVGEMRDLETIATTITAAETGHLVFATLHTNSAAQSIHRIIDVFPADQQNQIRFQLASSLLAVVSQRLIPKTTGGFVPACEVMLCNSAIANLIRENKTHEIPSVLETSMKDGMISFSRALSELVKKKEITAENAAIYAINPADLKNLL